jgi:acyl-[acyl-carrier-protein]-phospholipid O-acyltransferase/long-chain-fatty-acid--[acyl-carrier-protein] ligase
MNVPNHQDQSAGIHPAPSAETAVNEGNLIMTDALPQLNRDRSFWGMAATQFLGAFNDNLFKQLILLLATPTAMQVAAALQSGADVATDRQSTAMIVFSLPFLLFSGFAGFVSDRVSKRVVVVTAKLAEVVIMLLGFLGFWWYDIVGFNGMLVVLFLMGTHSAFFGPAKYGILPEMLRPADLPKANGLFLMLTFFAIILGTAAAGYLLTYFGGRVWIGSLICIAIAVIGTLTALLVRQVPVAKPDLEHRWSSWFVPPDILRLLKRDRQLLAAIAVVAMFWLVAGIVAQTVNALGLTQLGLDEAKTSLMTTSISLGIAVGCALGGYFSRDRINRRVVSTGLWGLVTTLLVLSLRGGPNQHLLGYYGSYPALILMGVFTGMFVVPVQVTVQSRPPREDKGRVVATMNQCTWLGIILGAILYSACIMVLDATGWPRNTIFAVTAALMLPVALFYRPKDVRLLDIQRAG